MEYADNQRQRARHFIGLACTLFLVACASSKPDPFLEDGSWDQAVVHYRAMLAGNPDDAAARRNLGIALLESGDAAAAATELEQAYEKSPDDVRALYFLARSLDDSGRVDDALRHYSDYVSKTDEDARWVRSRIHELGLAKATADIHAALARENALTVDRIPENAVAVPPFLNVAARSDLEAMTRGLASLLVTDLSQVDELVVVERERLQVLLREVAMATPRAAEPTELQSLDTRAGIQERLQILLKPGTGEAYFQGRANGENSPQFAAAVKRFQEDHGLEADGVPGPRTKEAIRSALGESASAPPATKQPAIVDPSTAPRIGKLVGARRFVQGTFAPVGDDDVQLDAAILETRSGTRQGAGNPVKGRIRQVMQLEKQLVAEILGALGIRPSPEEQRRLSEPSTGEFLAFLAYGRGLLLEEEGRMSEARDSYQEAVQIDPGFGLARTRFDLLGTTNEDRERLDRAEQVGDSRAGDGDARDRLLRTGGWIGIGPTPFQDRDGDDDPAVTDAEKLQGGTYGTIIIGGDLPDRGVRP